MKTANARITYSILTIDLYCTVLLLFVNIDKRLVNLIVVHISARLIRIDFVWIMFCASYVQYVTTQAEKMYTVKKAMLKTVKFRYIQKFRRTKQRAGWNFPTPTLFGPATPSPFRNLTSQFYSVVTKFFLGDISRNFCIIFRDTYHQKFEWNFVISGAISSFSFRLKIFWHTFQFPLWNFQNVNVKFRDYFAAMSRNIADEKL